VFYFLTERWVLPAFGETKEEKERDAQRLEKVNLKNQ
jgi:hypothetical protein